MADTVNKGMYHISDNPAFYEPARSNTFEFVVTNIDNLLSVDGETVYRNAQEVLRYSVDSVSVPHFKQTPIIIRRGNSVMKAAGAPEFSEGTLVINDYIGVNSKSLLMSWQQLSYIVGKDAVGNMVDYKKDCYLLEYSPSYELIRTWVLKGCWISGLDEGNFDNNETNSARKITATISYDRAYLV